MGGLGGNSGNMGYGMSAGMKSGSVLGGSGLEWDGGNIGGEFRTV